MATRKKRQCQTPFIHDRPLCLRPGYGPESMSLDSAWISPQSVPTVVSDSLPDTAIVFNPTAASGRTAERWPDIQRFAREFGIRFARYETQPAGGTAGLAEQLATAGHIKTIACVGGDGTVSQVIQGIMAAHDKHKVPREQLPALGLIPFGTGNDIAKSLGIPLAGGPFLNDLKKAVETIRFGADFRLDLGYIDGIYFADAFSIGIDSAVLQARNKERERIQNNPVLRRILRGYTLYFVEGVKQAVGYQAVPARIVMDGERTIKVRQLTNLIVNNTKVYGGEFVFSKESRANDGLLEVVIFSGWPEYFSKMLAGVRPAQIDDRQVEQLLVKHSRNYQAKRIKIKLSTPKDSQIDGEVHRTGRVFEITCVENALTLKTPVG